MTIEDKNQNPPITGYRCRSGFHLHEELEDAQYCDAVRAKREELFRLREKAVSQGWCLGTNHEGVLLFVRESVGHTCLIRDELETLKEIVSCDPSES